MLLIDDAIQHIKEQQQVDGGFLSLSSTNPNDFSQAITRSTTFFTSVILLCLTSIDRRAGRLSDRSIKNVQIIAKKAAGFLLKQKGTSWTFNYWATGVPERKTMPYPDDLDDTFTALAALYHYDKTLIDGDALSCVAQILTALETGEGGPYKTWIVSSDAPKKWRDVDLSVNAVIASFLALLDITLPNMEQFIADAVMKEGLASPYYPDASYALYRIARLIKISEQNSYQNAAGAMPAMCERYLSKKQNPLTIAMMISAAADLNIKTPSRKDAIASIKSAFEKDGWRAYPFCIDPERQNKRSYAGASALTGAFCAEALATCINIPQKKTPRVLSDKKEYSRFHHRTQQLAYKKISGAGHELRAATRKTIARTTDVKITAPIFALRKILEEKGKLIPTEISEQLALGGLFGWAAHTIYDDLLDDEKSDPLLLPSANFFIRKVHSIYHALGDKNQDVRRLFNTMMDEMDSANTWEQTHCRMVTGDHRIPAVLPRFGSYDRLASKSIGHAMGPLAEILMAGYDAHSREYRNAAKFFRHYLVARQLNDDAHDWPEDLAAGRINSVGAIVLTHFRKKFPGESKTPKTRSTINLMPKLQEIFWKDIIHEISWTIARQIARARKIRNTSALFGGTNFMEDALDALEGAAEKAARERDATLDFINHYKPKQTSGNKK